MKYNFAIICGLLMLLVYTGAGNAADKRAHIPLLTDAAAAQAFVQHARDAGGRCYVSDLRRDDAGNLLKGDSETALPAGRYLLHVPLALAPLGDLQISAITVTITAGKENRTVTMLNFPVADEFTDLPLAFTAPGGQRMPVSISWTITGMLAKKNRLQALGDPKGPDEAKDEENTDTAVPDDEGRISLTELSKLPRHLAAAGLCLEPLSPLALTVSTDKIVYQPGEKGVATVSVKNCGDAPAHATVSAEVVAGMQSTRPAGSGALDIPPGETRVWTGSFETTGMRWGAELHAVARAGDGVAAGKRAIFGVTNNFWETSINSGMMFSADFIDPAKAEEFMEAKKEAGFTQLESGFWAPDEFGNFTPKTDIFFGGQGAYPGSVTGTKNVLRAAHNRGIYATVYSNLWGGDGYDSYAQARRHPDWFTAHGGAYSDWLENWELMFKKKVPPIHVWPYTCITWDEQHIEPLKWHANELIGTHRQIGWDGVRYDSYAADDKGNVLATKIVRDLVDPVEPTFRWGYNSSVPKATTPEMWDVMCHGGELVMEEGLRGYAAQPSSITTYLNTLAGFRDTIWSHDGHLGICYDVPGMLRNGTLLDQVYFCCSILVTGSHPYYGQMDRSLGDFPGFALRYSEYIYNNAMRPLTNPEQVVTFGNNPKLLSWARLAKRLDMGEDRHRVVLQLVNPPVDDLTLHNAALKTPAPLRNLPVTLALPAGARVTGAWALCPIPTPTQQTLPVTGTDKVTLTVPEVRFWTVVVVDYTAKEGLR